MSVNTVVQPRMSKRENFRFPALLTPAANPGDGVFLFTANDRAIRLTTINESTLNQASMTGLFYKADSGQWTLFEGTLELSNAREA